VLTAILIIGVAGYMSIEEMSIVDALYMTVITVSTVGFREVRELSTGGRLFTILIIVGGVGTLGFAAATTIEYLVGGHLVTRFSARRKAQGLSNLRDHYVLCGYGRLGSITAIELRDSGHEVVVIDIDEESCQKADADGFIYINDQASSASALRQAGIERAAGLIVSTRSDAENVYTVLTARSVAPEITIVARSSHSEASERLLAAGAKRTFSPYEEGALSIATYVLRPIVSEVVQELADPHSRDLGIEEIRATEGGALVGNRVRDLDLRPHYQAAIVAISRNGRLELVPGGDEFIQDGDVLVVVGRPADIKRFVDDRAAGTLPAQRQTKGNEG
jgi:voltage-gated potassium channel